MHVGLSDLAMANGLGLQQRCALSSPSSVPHDGEHYPHKVPCVWSSFFNHGHVLNERRPSPVARRPLHCAYVYVSRS